MRVAIVRETRTGELRPVLLPKDLIALRSLPVEVLVETGLGLGVGCTDTDYTTVMPKAKIVDTETAWKRANLILKLKRPMVSDLERLSEGVTIAALFHAEEAPEVVDILLRSRLRAYSYEYFSDASGEHPLMAATGEIAGKQAVIYSAYHLQSHLSGSGRLLPACNSAIQARIAVLGYGNVGRAAARLAQAMGATTYVFRWEPQNGKTISTKDSGIIFFPWSKAVASEIIPSCDVIIGAIRISTFDTTPFITADMVRRMRPGSVIIDVTAGYGSGYIETSAQKTHLNDPFVVIHGVKHVKIRELPLGVHLTAAEQISNQWAPHLAGLVSALATGRTYEVAEPGKITEDGRITNEHVLRHYQRRYHE